MSNKVLLPPLSRRAFLGGGAALATVASLAPQQAEAVIGIDGFKGALSAESLRLEPNAALDQTDILQNGIDLAARVGNPLFLPPGRYVVTGLTLPSGAHLVGVPGATRLLLGRSGAAVRTQDTENVSLTAITLEGLRLPIAAQEGVFTALNCSNLVIDGCTVTGAATHGIYMDGCAGRILNSTITGCGEAAVHAINSSGLRISGNMISDCENNGILIWRSAEGEDGTIVSENRISRIGAINGGEGQWGNGINIFRADNVTVTNNRIKDCAFSAVRSNAGSACQIMGNNCTRLGEVAIYAEFGYQGAIISNNLVEEAATGISMTNFNEGGRLAVCSGNIVRGLYLRDHYDKRGVGIAAEADTAVTGNVVEEAPTAGILLGWGPHLRDISATGNVVRNATIGIGVSVAEGAGHAIIADNMISGTNKGAIVGMAWGEIITEDLAKAADARFPNINVSRNRVI